MEGDKKPEEPANHADSSNFHLDLSNLRTTTPLPGLRDSDVDSTAMPSARHAMKDEYSSYVRLAKQGGHQDLLKIEGVTNGDHNGEKKNKINENDSDYVKIAKTGGHAGLLKMDGGAKDKATVQKPVIKEHDSEYVKMAKTGGHADLIKTEGVVVADAPKKQYIKDTDSEYVKLAKTGGHQGLLQSDVPPVDTSVSKFKVKDSDSEYIKLAKTGGHANLLANESSQPRPQTANSRRNMISENDTAYVKLAKKGGDSNLLKMDEAKPPSKKVSYKNNSSDWFQHDEKRAPDAITTGKGRGVRKEANNNMPGNSILPGSQEQVGKTGKRLFQPAGTRDAPFALHY
eukprot:gene17397-19140_t